jgi:hypothetical protein
MDLKRIVVTVPARNEAATLVVSKSYVDFRARVESLQLFLFWVITWAVVIVAVFPTVIDFMTSYYGRAQTGVGTFLGMALNSGNGLKPALEDAQVRGSPNSFKTALCLTMQSVL